MDTIKKQVMDILSHDADQILELSGDSLIGTSSTSYPMMQHLEDDIIQRLDDDLEIIVERLRRKPPWDLDVVTISGMGDIGKTTLAKKVYDHLTIRYHFDILAWITISQEFRFRNVLLEALHCISKETDIVNSKDYDKIDDNELADVVSKSLAVRRYLVVVDDIWSTDVWDRIRGIFPNYDNMSRILLTTRETKYYSVDDCCTLLPPVARSIHLFSQLDLAFKTRVKLLRKLPIHHYNPIIHEFFSRFNLLRVLAIFSTDVRFESFPIVITKLFHLRYLQVQFDGDIPESISELQNLQTLICNGHTSLPEKIWTMKNLRYICMKGPSCLPSPRTEHLETGMPNLEEFSVLSYTSCTKEFFYDIPNLKRLIIHLPFDWGDISSTVMMLPKLEELKIKGCQATRYVWRLSDKDKFQSLKLLLLNDVDLGHWEASGDNFRNLKRLVLKKCRWLQKIPADFGEICTLESIQLHDCSNITVKSARNIAQEQEKMGNNFLKVFIHNGGRDGAYFEGVPSKFRIL